MNGFSIINSSEKDVNDPESKLISLNKDSLINNREKTVLDLLEEKREKKSYRYDEFKYWCRDNSPFRSAHELSFDFNFLNLISDNCL